LDKELLEAVTAVADQVVLTEGNLKAATEEHMVVVEVAVVQIMERRVQFVLFGLVTHANSQAHA